MCLPAAVGNLHIVEELIGAGAKVNGQDRWQGTPLVDAMREGHTKVVRYLREKGGALMWDEGKESGELCELARAGDLEKVKLLLMCGCDPNAADCKHELELPTCRRVRQDSASHAVSLPLLCAAQTTSAPASTSPGRRGT